jgi:hypothetical protein
VVSISKSEFADIDTLSADPHKDIAVLESVGFVMKSRGII